MYPEMNSLEDLRRELRDRIKYDYSQKDMAKEIGISHTLLCEILKGDKNPNAACISFLGYGLTSYYKKREK